MDELIIQLDRARSALGQLDIRSSRKNLDCLLGSMQIIDQVILALQTKQEGGETSGDHQP